MWQKIKDVLLAVLAIGGAVLAAVLFIFRGKEEKGEATIKVSNPNRKSDSDKADSINSAIDNLDK